MGRSPASAVPFTAPRRPLALRSGTHPGLRAPRPNGLGVNRTRSMSGRDREAGGHKGWGKDLPPRWWHATARWHGAPDHACRIVERDARQRPVISSCTIRRWDDRLPNVVGKEEPRGWDDRRNCIALRTRAPAGIADDREHQCVAVQAQRAAIRGGQPRLAVWPVTAGREDEVSRFLRPGHVPRDVGGRGELVAQAERRAADVGDPDRWKRESRQVGRSGAADRLRQAGETRIDGRELTLERPARRIDREGRVAGDGISAHPLNQPAEQALVVTCRHSRGTTAASSELPDGSRQKIGSRARSSRPSRTRSRLPSDSIRLMYESPAQPNAGPLTVTNHVVVEVHVGRRRDAVQAPRAPRCARQARRATPP